MWPTSMPSYILIHPTVWPQYTTFIDRQTGQDNGQIAYMANRFTNGLPKILLKQVVKVI